MRPWSPIRRVLLATSALVPLGLAPVHANPQGGQVVGGNAQIQGQGTASVTVTQTTDRAIINWHTFNIATGERVQFVQPGSSSIALNRVTGGLGPSIIAGTLTANGRVFLVNPDGILFGAGAVVDTAGFLATTHDIKNDDFMAGRFNFNISGRADASIVNLGSITAHHSGFAALVAPGVRNAGTITANLGKVAMASANGFSLDFYGDKLITLAVSDQIAAQVKDIATGEPLDALVKNEGKLKANGGQVQLSAVTARAVVDSVINNSGVIEARTVGTRNGKIVLGVPTASTKLAGARTQTVKLSGTLNVSGRRSGQKGGTVQVTGENIEVAGATIDASGRAGGGNVLIGGDTGGGQSHWAVAQIAKAALESAPIATATTVSVDAWSRIDASAKDTGDGGKVIVWADGTTSYGGTILARGGASAGNGGFVEVSGLQSLAYYGLVDTRAPMGAAGTLLLDPYNIQIGSGATSGGSLGGGSFTPSADDSFLDASALASALTSSNVIVTTGLSGSPGSQAGNITVTAPVSWASAYTLTLSAANDISIGAALNSTLGGLVISAGNSVTATAAIAVHNFTLTGGNWVQTGALASFDVANDFKISGGSFLRASGGLGTTISPYLIADVYGLQGIGSSALLRSRSYRLTQNIDASGTANWNAGEGFKPIGTMGGGAFTGNLDGDNHTISDLTFAPTVATTTNVGLFGSIGSAGTVKDLSLTDVNIVANIPLSTTSVEVGAIAGHNSGEIVNVAATGTVSSNSTRLHIGGLVGFNDDNGTITDSRADVAVTASGNVPINASNCSFLTNCHYVSAGGLVGFNMGTIEGTVSPDNTYGALSGSGTFAMGNVSVGSHATAGGFAGFSDGIIEKAGAWGNVTGAAGTAGVGGQDRITQLGGFVGMHWGVITDSEAHGNVGSAVAYLEAGGFAGGNAGTIETSTATGNVTAGAHSQAGGFAGSSMPMWLSCYGCYTGIGYNNDGLIAESSSSGTVTVGTASVAGGFAGVIQDSFENTSSSVVSGTDNSILGGFAGVVEVDAIVAYSDSSGAVTGSGASNWIGGFAGVNAGFISLGSSSSGTVQGTSGSVLGGLVALNIGQINAASSWSIVQGPGADNVSGGLVGANFGTVVGSTASGAVSGGANNTLGSLVGANGNIANVAPGQVFGSTFPVGTIVSSTATGTVNGVTGLQVGTYNLGAMPLAPSVLDGCDGGLCEFLKNPRLIAAPTTPVLPDDVFATALILSLLAPSDKSDQKNTVEALIAIATTPAGPPAGAPGQPGAGNQGDGADSQPGARGPINPATGMPPQPLRPIAGADGERFSSIPPIGETRFISNEVVVQIPESVPLEQLNTIAQSLGLSVLSQQSLSALGRRALRFQLSGGRNVRDIIRALEANSIVAVAQPNYRFQLTQGLAPASAPTTNPELAQRGDPSQYMMGKLHLSEAHRIADGKNILVAVIDSEVDTDHSELAGVISQRYAASGDQEKAHSHGTAMAGAIASRDRLLGVAPSAKIIAIRAFSESNNTAESTTYSILRSIDYAVAQGAKVINMSFAGPADPSLHRTLKAAAEKGVILIGAAGNAGPKSPPLYPGADPNVIAVTATDSNDRLFKMANRGPHLSVAAPGVEILAPAPQAGYQMSTGTSIATAHVTGVVALMLEKDPSLTPADVRRILETTAQDLGPKGKDTQFGWGLVDPHKALQAVMLRDAAKKRQQTQ